MSNPDDILDTVDEFWADDGSDPTDADIERLAEEWENDEADEWEQFRTSAEVDMGTFAQQFQL